MFAVAVSNIVRLTSISTEILGASIDVRVGWGLWVVALSSAALSVTVAIVAVQVGSAYVSDPGQAPWVSAWGWSAVVLPAHDTDEKGRQKMPAYLLTAHKEG